MAKVRVTFDLDLGKLAPEIFAQYRDPLVAAEVALDTMLLDPSRQASLAEVRRVQGDPSMERSTKAPLMASFLRRAMVPMQAKANLKVEMIPEDSLILTDHPLERRCAA